MSTLVATVVFLCVALAAWLSQAALALTDAGAGTDRVALLPLSATAVAVALLAACLVTWAARRVGALIPLSLLGFLALPWLPVDVPGAFLLWTGPMALVVWLAVAAGFTTALWRSPARHLKRPAVVAGLLALAVYSIAAWQVSPSVPGGDEPHYLVITQSLLYDHDLKIENNHLRGDYKPYYAGDLAPHYLRRGRDGEIYSIHAPGLPALVAPAFAIGGYRAVVVFLVALSALGSGLAWHLAWLRTRRADAAWFGWAAVTLCTTTVFHAFTVYPDPVAGIVVLTGLWALLRADADRQSGDVRLWPWLLHGAALALLPWLHTRFVLLAAGLGALILLRLSATRSAVGKTLAFLVVPSISAVCWIGYFVAIYGTPSPLAPYGGDIGTLDFVAGGLAGLLFDQRFGLLTYAPVLTFAFAGIVAMLAPRVFRVSLQPGACRFALELLVLLVPYLVMVTSYRMWWAGSSAPARFFVPVLLLLAIPAAEAWTAIRHRATRATALAALLFTTFASAVLVFVDGGTLAYNARTEYSRWIEWLTLNADLARGMPAWFGSDPELFRDSMIWCGAMVLGWGVLRLVERAPLLRGRAPLTTATAAVYGVAAMLAATLVWTLAGVRGTTAVAAQLNLLRRTSLERHALAVGVLPWHRVNIRALPATLRLRLSRLPAPEGSGGSDGSLFVLPGVPAGDYSLMPRINGAGGRLMVGIGRDQFSVQSGVAATSEPVLVRFPVDVRAMIVRGDEGTWKTVRGLTVAPLSIVPPSARLTDQFARHAVRYGDATVFFLDDRSFPEPEAFWVGGSRQSSIVLQADRPVRSVSLLLRNAPVDNSLLIQAGKWQDEFRLRPGEERRVEIPLDAARDATLVSLTSASGFTPSAVEPGSRDHRFLGVWVKVLGF